MNAMEPADLRDALSLTAVHERPGLYRGALDHAWSFLLPSGGVLTSLALAAMRLELSRRSLDALVPASATATFCSAIAEGPLEVEVAVLRAGRSAAQLRAHLRSLAQEAAPGDVGLEVTATFVLPRDLADLAATTWATFPQELPSEAVCEAYDAASAQRVPPNFYRNFVVKRALGDVWWSRTWAPGEPRVARYFQYRVPPTTPDGALECLALPPIADTMASAVHQAVGSRTPPLLFPSLDLTVHFVAPHGLRPDLPVLVDARAHALFSSAASASATLWQGERLVMVATQTMTLRTLRREPAR